ncbi:uncharacterized protein LOC124255123 [Haliotis rubra]|uniref:uncharacterized protein LOC124255123 n=1 Tax=Haliotis rubra TaxID=36100 RepID=UPI001EE5BEA6|nr:uncharacterized protein LOC124255123 [Haliotis rubra]
MSGFNDRRGTNPNFGFSTMSEEYRLDKEELTARYRDILNSTQGVGEREVKQLPGVDALMGSDPSSGKRELDQLSGVVAPKGGDSNSGDSEGEQLSGVDASKGSDPSLGKSEVEQLSGVDALKGSDPNSGDSEGEQLSGVDASKGGDPSSGKREVEQLSGVDAPKGSDPNSGDSEGNGGLSEDHGANGCDPFFKDAFGIVVEKSTEQYFGRPAPVGSDPIYPFPTQSPSIDISFGGFQGNSEVEQLSGVVALKGSDLVCEVGQLSGVDASKGSDLNSGKSEVERLSGVDASKGSDLNSGKREIEQLSGVDASKGIDLNSGKREVERLSGVDASKGSDLNSGKREIEQLSGVDASKGIDLNSGKGEVERLSGVDASKGSDLNSGKREIEQLSDVHASKGSDLNSGKSEVGQLSGVDAPKGHSAQGVGNSEVVHLSRVDGAERSGVHDDKLHVIVRKDDFWNVVGGRKMRSINVTGRESNPLTSYATVTAIEKNPQEKREKHNQKELDFSKPGDLLEFERGVYSHWAVYIGKEEVVHLSGVDGAGGSDLKHPCTISGVKSDKGIVRKDNFWTVAEESKAKKNNSKDSELHHLEPSRIVQRALSEVGKVGYNLLYKNCEHFAKWCRYGKEESDQAKVLCNAVAMVVGSAAVVVAGVALTAWFS